MASGPLGAGGGAGEKHRWAESKVYTRKAHRKAPKSNPNPPPQPPQEQPHQQKPPPETLDASNSPSGVPQHENRADAAPGAENRENGAVPMVSHRVENGELHRVINFAARSAAEARELRRKLAEELEQVRGFIRKLEAREQQQQAAAAAVTTTYDSHSQFLGNDIPLVTPAAVTTTYDSHSQFLGNDIPLVTPPKLPAVNSDQLPLHQLPLPPPSLHRQLSVSVASGQMENHSTSDVLEKEKRTPKANQFYRSSDFITGKDRFPLSDPHKKSKANGSRKSMDGIPTGMDRFYVQAFKSCSALLTRLMKHKHGWVFNTPVDVKGLGLYDYHLIIKHPMDLGTVKTRLNNNWYKSPREFAEDVRLTFHNAMTYNPKGQDVHVMAEQLLKIFEEKWPSIEAEITMPSYPIMPKKMPPPPLDMRRILERSDSTAHQVFPDTTHKAVSYTPQSHSARAPALKKPKAKDINKRDMTFDEKQKLSNNLQSLPSEKLDIVVQIIKKRNSSLHQHDDEIEVDIDSVDTETLWELDRFVTNYKKSLSKHKRKAELAFQAKLEAEKNAQKLQSQGVVVGEVPVEGKTDEKNVGYSSQGADKAKGDNESVSTSSSSSSSDSGSSSSDSDSESSSS